MQTLYQTLPDIIARLISEMLFNIPYESYTLYSIKRASIQQIRFSLRDTATFELINLPNMSMFQKFLSFIGGCSHKCCFARTTAFIDFKPSKIYLTINEFLTTVLCLLHRIRAALIYQLLVLCWTMDNPFRAEIRYRGSEI
jgi:hypothetical protein